jgi:phage baseplate assembly protein W
MTEGLIGSGWAFPVRTDSGGRIALASGEQEIEESIRLILGTARGERPMRPDFGCGIQEHVFAAGNSETVGSIGRDVRESLARWEPRIDVQEVNVRVAPDEPSLILIDVSYAIRRTNDPRNLVFPFYLIPTERTAAAGQGRAQEA